MTQSVELLLSDALAGAVRREWQVLLDADLPSQARHTGESNAPHVTLGVAAEVDDDVEAALARIRFGAGAEVRLGGLLVFGGERAGPPSTVPFRYVLSRAVLPSETLLSTHREVQRALGEAPGRPDNLLPDRWTPHVTLARRLDADQLAAAIAALSGAPNELVGEIAVVRRWDSDRRMTWTLGADA